MSTIYLNGIYQAKMNQLIKEEDINKLNKSDLLNYLKNLNYGQGSNYLSIDNVISFELKNIRKELNELSGSNLLGDIFFVDEDLVNIKIVYKAVYENVLVENTSIISRFTKHDLFEFFGNNNEAFISNDDIKLLIKIKEVKEESLKKNLELIEKIYYNHILTLVKNDYPLLLSYFLTKNFNHNLLTFLKFKKRNNIDFNYLLLEQNNFPKSYWLELFELNNDQIIEKLSSTYFGKLTEGLEVFFSTNKTSVLDKVLNDILTDHAQTLSYNLKSVAPVISYLHLKNNEVIKLREAYYEDK